MTEFGGFPDPFQGSMMNNALLMNMLSPSTPYGSAAQSQYYQPYYHPQTYHQPYYPQGSYGNYTMQ